MSEAAQRAYPEPDWLDGFEAQTERVGKRVAFDRGAVEALRQEAADMLHGRGSHAEAENVERMADNWVVGQ